jgi:molybdenum cofactor biosynthesis protein MoaC
MPELTHFDDDTASRMVDISAKPETLPELRASGLVRMAPTTAALIFDKSLAKGDVLEVAHLPGMMAAKRTGELIPRCHPPPITSTTVDFHFICDDLLSIAAVADADGGRIDVEKAVVPRDGAVVVVVGKARMAVVEAADDAGGAVCEGKRLTLELAACDGEGNSCGHALRQPS